MTLPDYVTAANVKAHMPDPTWGSTYDTLLGLLITRASRLIDEESKEKAGGYAVSEDSTVYLRGTGTAELPLWSEPSVRYLAQAPTSVAISEDGDLTDYTTLAATDYLLEPYNALDYGEPYRKLTLDIRNGNYAIWPSFPKAVKIVGRVGWSVSVPSTIEEAAIIQVIRWFKRSQQAFQDVGAIVQLGQLRYVKTLDPDVARTVRHFAMQKMTV